MSNGGVVFGSGEPRYFIPAPPAPPASASWENRAAAATLNEQSGRIYNGAQSATAIASVLSSALEGFAADAEADGNQTVAIRAQNLITALNSQAIEMAAFAETFDEFVDRAYDHFVASGGTDPYAFFREGTGLEQKLREWGVEGSDVGLWFEFMLIVSMIQDLLGSLAGACSAGARWMCENLWTPKCDPPMIPDPPCKYVNDSWEPGDPPPDPGSGAGHGSSGSSPTADANEPGDEVPDGQDGDLPKEGHEGGKGAKKGEGGQPGVGRSDAGGGPGAAAGITVTPPPADGASGGAESGPRSTGKPRPAPAGPSGGVGSTPASVATSDGPDRQLVVCGPYVMLAKNILTSLYATRRMNPPDSVLTPGSRTWAVADAEMLEEFKKKFAGDRGLFDTDGPCIHLVVGGATASLEQKRATASPAGSEPAAGAAPGPASGPATAPASSADGGRVESQPPASAPRGAALGSVSPGSPNPCEPYWRAAWQVLASAYGNRDMTRLVPVSRSGWEEYPRARGIVEISG